MDLQATVISELRQFFDQESDQIELIDEKGDGRHYLLKIVSGKFADMSRLEQRRSVYKILNPYIQRGIIHALRMELKAN